MPKLSSILFNIGMVCGKLVEIKGRKTGRQLTRRIIIECELVE